jgi:iron complex outermembrane receptor protein
MRNSAIRLALLTASSSMWVGHALAQSTEQGPSEEVIVTGTRVADRSALETAVPVDVVSNESLQNLGVTEVSQALSVSLPSFNFPRPGLADGTDTVRPATLRGLAPDQTLVLVNGKRRHSSALVNLNGTIGRGSAAVDLNTIPNSIVQSIEVLRDGASAQYGSDAIAGVINLRLRENREGGDIGMTYGWRESSYESFTTPPPAGATWSAPAKIKRDVSDGETLTVSAWKGLPLGEDGFVTIAAEYRDQERTERGGYDYRQQYSRVGGAFDPREATFDRFNAWYGEPELDQKTLFANAGYDLSDSMQVYGWASYQDRDAKSAGFFRRALDDRNVTAIYPNGFLPIIAPEVTDYAAGGGVKWELGDWDFDSSLVYGKNKMEYTIENTLNRSLGTSSQTSFDAGGYDYDQVVFNVAAVRPISVSMLSSPLNVAVGIEARREGFGIFAGEPNSYRNGGVLLPLNTVGTPGCVAPFTAAQLTAGGCPTPSGSQVFPGFQPGDVTDEHRSAIGAYVDLEANITEKFLASLALRGESYSDFGENVSGKISLRYDFIENFALRGSAQNGFRAPSLQQQFFRSTSTNFINGVPFDILTLPSTNPVSVALGGTQLDAEESVNFSIGAVMRFGDLSLTIDAYQINIDDRIVLSENLNQGNVQAYLGTQGFTAIGGARFFINGVDTETQGVDIVANYPFDLAAAGKLDLTFTANFNSTDVKRVPQTAQLAALSPAPSLFDRVNVLTFEEGNPESKFALAANWQLDRLAVTFRATRYGEVLTPGTTAALDFTDSAATLIDLEGRFGITENIKVALGADNITDEYPDPVPPALNTTGNAPYSNYGAFGRSGRFVYGRLTYTF